MCQKAQRAQGNHQNNSLYCRNGKDCIPPPDQPLGLYNQRLLLSRYVALITLSTPLWQGSNRWTRTLFQSLRAGAMATIQQSGLFFFFFFICCIHSNVCKIRMWKRASCCTILSNVPREQQQQPGLLGSWMLSGRCRAV